MQCFSICRSGERPMWVILGVISYDASIFCKCMQHRLSGRRTELVTKGIRIVNRVLIRQKYYALAIFLKIVLDFS